MLKRFLIFMCMLLWPIAGYAVTSALSIHGNTKVVDFATGENHVVALLNDNSAISWGAGGDNQQLVPNPRTGVTAVGAGNWHTLVVNTDGSVSAFGHWAEPLLDGTTDITVTVPAALAGPNPTPKATAVAGGLAHSAALLENGTVLVWTSDAPADIYGVTAIPAGLSGKTVTAIAAGHHHMVALTSDGQIFTWGAGGGADNGQTTIPALLAADLAGGAKVTAIAAKAYNTMALTDNGHVYVFGLNDAGQATVPPAANGATAIGLGSHHALAIVGGQVVAWGDNSQGQLNVPANLLPATKVGGGAYFSLALLGNTDLVGWGSNNASQLEIPVATAAPLANGSVTCCASNSPPGGCVDITDASVADATAVCTIVPLTGTVTTFALNGVDMLTDASDGSVTFVVPTLVTPAPAGTSPPPNYSTITALFGTGDTTPPTVATFDVPANSNTLTVPVNAFTSNDNDVAGYIITTSNVPPLANALGWTANPPANFTVSTGGTVTLYAWVKDTSGNVSTTPLTDTVQVSVDASAPQITTFNVTGSPTLIRLLGLLHLTNLSARVDFVATDDLGVTGYLITTTNTPPALNDPGWTLLPPLRYRLDYTQVNTVYGWVKDAAGNITGATAMVQQPPPPQ